jgi:hypothetical protein
MGKSKNNSPSTNLSINHQCIKKKDKKQQIKILASMIGTLHREK